MKTEDCLIGQFFIFSLA